MPEALAISQSTLPVPPLSLRRALSIELADHAVAAAVQPSFWSAAADRDLRLPDLQGHGSLNWAFLHPDSEAGWRAGGGMANAIVGPA